MTDYTAQLAVEEYRALRATIRERGSLRVLVTAITFLSWAAFLLVAFSLFVVPYIALVPLAALWAGFEVAYAIHIGVERIGRYLELRYETVTGDGPRWEHLAARPPGPSGGVHALFLPVFMVAIVIGLLTAALMAAGPAAAENGATIELLVVAVLHGAVLARMLAAARFAASQRDRDRAALRAALDTGSSPSSSN
jgi:hypothetical protein